MGTLLTLRDSWRQFCVAQVGGCQCCLCTLHQVDCLPPGWEEDQPVINIKILVHEFFGVFPVDVLAFISRLSQAERGDCGGGGVAKKMDLHTIIDYVVIWIVLAKPEEAQEISVFFINKKRVEHLFNVRSHRNWILPKT